MRAGQIMESNQDRGKGRRLTAELSMSVFKRSNASSVVAGALEGRVAAQYQLARMYQHGQGVKKSMRQSEQWLSLIHI